MAFIFLPRSTPVGNMASHSRPGTPRSPLPAIAEDGTNYFEPRDPPPIPPRASHRPMPKKLIFGAPPRHNYEGTPPPYSGFDPVGVEGPNGEKLADIRRNVTNNVKNNKFVAKRGGWKRLAIVAVVLICVIVGLVVGLVVGLYNRRPSSQTDGSGSSPAGGASGTVSGPGNPASNTTFPAGSYRFDTFLETISANCTSNSATWMCYPYMTYAQSPLASAATFDWIISPSLDSSSTGYTISSTPNYFSVVFSNATLTLQNEGQSDEHYFFQTVMQKPTKPTSQLGSSNVASTCYFNKTTFQGYLYTKMNATYGSSSGANTNDTSDPFLPWPYAVRVEQIAAAGAGSPTCLGPDGQSLGNFSVSDDSQLCDCVYLNTGT